MTKILTKAQLVLVATVIALLGFVLGGKPARASGIPTSNAIAYTGTLLNNGAPDSASHFIIVKLWATLDGGTAACSTVPSGNTQLVNGRFTIPLDPSCVSAIHQDPNLNVEVVIDGSSMGRTPLHATPYAVEADTSSNFAPGSQIASLVPPGSVMAYAGVVSSTVPPPSGWLLCDGSAVSRITYAALFTSIGTTAGAGDGASTFNLPDYRGYFLRGQDQGTGHDPDSSSRTALNIGGNTADAVGTLEACQVQMQSHVLTDPGHVHSSPSDDGNTAGANLGFNQTYNRVQGFVQGVTSDLNTTGITILDAGGSETRPVNVAVNYIIKY